MPGAALHNLGHREGAPDPTQMSSAPAGGGVWQPENPSQGDVSQGFKPPVQASALHWPRLTRHKADTIIKNFWTATAEHYTPGPEPRTPCDCIGQRPVKLAL